MTDAVSTWRPEAIPAPVRTLGAVPLSQLDRDPPRPLLLDRLDPGESTVLFGPGGVGKGSLASSWVARLARAGRRVLVLDYEDHGGEWARRIFGLGGQEVMEDVLWVAPLREGLGALPQAAEAVRALVVAQEVDYVVIDSAVIACGVDDPMKPESASRYFGALQAIGVPTLTLAHVTKLHDARYPFGSVFWHNLARVTWSLMPKGDELLLTNRKANNYARQAAQSVTISWWDGTLREVGERSAELNLRDRILDVLSDGKPMTPAAIADELNDGLPSDEHVKPETVRRTLNRSLTRRGGSPVTTEEGRWRLAGGADE